jgi:hypothetical protein
VTKPGLVGLCSAALTGAFALIDFSFCFHEYTPVCTFSERELRSC